MVLIFSSINLLDLLSLPNFHIFKCTHKMHTLTPTAPHIYLHLSHQEMHSISLFLCFFPPSDDLTVLIKLILILSSICK